MHLTLILTEYSMGKMTFKKIKIIIFLLFITLFSSCHRAKPIEEHPYLIWEKYTYRDYNGFLYLYHDEKKEELTALLCADISGIKGRLRLSHECIGEEFSALNQKLCGLGASFLGRVESPDFSEYPDLSMYLTFVISRDELSQIWKNLGLE